VVVCVAVLLAYAAFSPYVSSFEPDLLNYTMFSHVIVSCFTFLK
jgi:hypothetical protein